jgi:hypothetical protein
MTNLTSTHKFSAAAAFGAAALFSMLSFGSSAEASSVLNCKGASAAKIASCCEKVVGENGRRPLWMIQARMNCHDTVAFVKCQGRECYVRVVLIDRDGGDGEEGGGDPGRSPNTPR